MHVSNGHVAEFFFRLTDHAWWDCNRYMYVLLRYIQLLQNLMFARCKLNQLPPHVIWNPPWDWVTIFKLIANRMCPLRVVGYVSRVYLVVIGQSKRWEIVLIVGYHARARGGNIRYFFLSTYLKHAGPSVFPLRYFSFDGRMKRRKNIGKKLNHSC